MIEWMNTSEFKCSRVAFDTDWYDIIEVKPSELEAKRKMEKEIYILCITSATIKVGVRKVGF